MSAHTPGPWRVHSFSLTEHVIPEVWGLSGDEYSDHIKRVEDARLIAAAPDLLEVAEMVLGMATVDMPQALIDAAGIAVAKARGAQP